MKKLYLFIFISLFTIKSLGQNGYVGEIRLFAGNFAPKGWQKCEGQDMPIARYNALFAIIGVQYGGDGRISFKLPDFRGRTAIGTSNNYPIGANSGAETVTLNSSNLPSHTHNATLTTSGLDGTIHTPSSTSVISSNRIVVNSVSYPMKTFNSSTANVPLAPMTTASNGSNTPINVSQPGLVLTYIICVDGVYPPRQ